MMLIIINNNKILFSLFLTLQMNGSRWLFSRTLGAASPPRVHFPLAWLFPCGLAPFHTYHRHYRDRLRNRLVPLRRSVLVLVCILVALSSISRARHESRAVLIETARRRRRRRRRRSRERRREFFCFVCALFFFCIFWCVFLFFSEFFFGVGRELGWSKRWRRITSLSIHPQSLACNVALQPELEFQYFLRSDFSLPADAGFAIFLPGRGKNEKRGGRRYLPCSDLPKFDHKRDFSRFSCSSNER